MAILYMHSLLDVTLCSINGPFCRQSQQQARRDIAVKHAQGPDRYILLQRFGYFESVFPPLLWELGITGSERDGPSSVSLSLCSSCCLSWMEWFPALHNLQKWKNLSSIHHNPHNGGNTHCGPYTWVGAITYFFSRPYCHHRLHNDLALGDKVTSRMSSCASSTMWIYRHICVCTTIEVYSYVCVIDICISVRVSIKRGVYTYAPPVNWGVHRGSIIWHMFSCRKQSITL